jgi:hypothetical protein
MDPDIQQFVAILTANVRISYGGSPVQVRGELPNTWASGLHRSFLTFATYIARDPYSRKNK